MNQRINVIIIGVLALMAGLYVTISVISGGGNEIGKLAVYASGGCLLLGMLAPKTGVYGLLFLAGYSDLIKRFMVLGSSISRLDLVYVLAMAPMLLAGVVLSLFIGRAIRGEITKAEMIRFVICSLMLAAVGVGTLLEGGGVGELRVVVDYGAFIYLLYVLPIIFPDRVQLLKYARFALLVFLPVAFYAVWQRVYGLSSFELDYLATGLSSESRQFSELIFRPFSTLNAASSLTIVMAACTMLAYLLWRARSVSAIVAVCMMFVFTAACICTLTRAGWVCLALAPFGILATRFRITTLGAYLVAIVGFVLLVIYSEWFAGNLHKWQADITGVEDYGRSAQALKITTLSDRFIGLSNLKNPENWTAFGVEDTKYYGDGRGENSTFSHDMITSFIFRRGLVPFGVLAVGGLVFAFWLHRRVLSQPWNERKLTTIALGSCFALLVSVLAGGYLFQFPANIFFWIIVCVTLSCLSNEDSSVSNVTRHEK